MFKVSRKISSCDVLSMHPILVAVLGVMALSTDTLLIRKVGVFQDMAVAFYRYTLLAGAIFVFTVIKQQGDFLNSFIRIGPYGVFAGAILGLSNTCFTFGVQNASVSSVLVLLATGSIFSSLFSWLFLGEVIPSRTIIALVISIGSVASIFTLQMHSSSSSSSGKPVGLIAAMCSAILIGAYFVVVKHAAIVARQKYPDLYVSMTPINVVSGIFAGLITLGLGAEPQSVNFNSEAGMYLLIQGLLVLTVAFSALTYAAETCPSTEVNLVMLIETLLGPLLVWVAGYEEPPAETMYFGSLIIATLFIHGLLSRKAELAGLESRNRELVSSFDNDVEMSVPTVGSQRHLLSGDEEDLAPATSMKVSSKDVVINEITLMEQKI